MIERTQAYRTEAGVFNTLEEAQKAELVRLLTNAQHANSLVDEPLKIEDWASWIVDNSERVLDILTTTATSKPKARKVNGGTKKRKAKATPDETLKFEGIAPK